MKNKLIPLLLSASLMIAFPCSSYATEIVEPEKPNINNEQQVDEFNQQINEVQEQSSITNTQEQQINIVNTQEQKTQPEEKPVVTKSASLSKSQSTELTITFKYRDRNNNAEWTTSSLSNTATSWKVLQAKANNVIANHKSITVGLQVYTFTGWDTSFPVTLSSENPSVLVTAEYDITKKPQLFFNYQDNISTGSGSWKNDSPFSGYTHTFSKPQDVNQYTFLYWEDKETGDIKYPGDKYTKKSSQLTQDTTVTYYAIYDFQPEVKLIYHYKEGIKDTGAKSEAIDIYANQPKNLKWFYEEEGGEPIPEGEMVPLPDLITKIHTKQNTEPEEVNVYAHYYTVTYKPGTQGTFLETSFEVEYGANTPVAPETTCKEGYKFDKWSPEIADIVIENAIYTAEWIEIKIPEDPEKTEEKEEPDNNPTVFPIIRNTRPVLTSTASLPTPSIAPNVTKPIDKVETIKNNPIPLQKSLGSWALLNLIATICSIILAILSFVLFFFKRKKTEEDKENEEYTIKKKRFLRRIVEIIISLAMIIIFILTEDTSLPMVWIDKYTILMLLLLLIHIVVIIIFRRKEKEDKEDKGEY